MIGDLIRSNNKYSEKYKLGFVCMRVMLTHVCIIPVDVSPINSKAEIMYKHKLPKCKLNVLSRPVFYALSNDALRTRFSVSLSHIC